MIKRHIAFKQKYPDREPGRGLPYGGIQNLRPETRKLLDVFKLSQGLMKPGGQNGSLPAESQKEE